MRRAELFVGMHVAAKRGAYVNEARVLAVSGWRYSSWRHEAETDERYPGVAIAFLCGYDPFSDAPDVIWRSDIVQPQQIISTWDEHLAAEETREAEQARVNAQARVHHAAKVARFDLLRPAFLSAGVTLEYGANVVLTIDQAEMVARALIGLTTEEPAHAHAE